MSKRDTPEPQDEPHKQPQEYMNDYLSTNDAGSQASRDSTSDANQHHHSSSSNNVNNSSNNFHGSSNNVQNNNNNNNNNNNSSSNNVNDINNNDDDHYIPSRDFAPQHRISASASYVPRKNGGENNDSGYQVQQVVPNTQHAMSRSNSGAQSTGYRNRAQSGVSSSNMNMRSLKSNANSTQDVQQPEASEDPRDSDVPLMIKPKTLYQNPQTPTVLPSTYHPINMWSTLKQTYLKEFLAEFMGTMVMIFFGCSVVCQVRSGQQQQRVTFLKQLASSQDIDAENKLALLQYLVPVDITGTFDDVALIWGGAVVMGYFAAGGSALSGGHMNPAITLSNCVFRGFPWRKVPIYWFGQLLGAYVGALVVFIYYQPVIDAVYPDWNGNETVLSMFCTDPLEYLTPSRQFVSELVGGAVLQIGMFALTDPYTCLRSDLFPLMLFVLMFCLIGSTSLQTGAGMNPARDLGPRLALASMGFEREVLWTNHHHYFWVPIVAPFVGALLGGTVYDICIYQGHESVLNWPFSLVRAKLRRIWALRPRFYKREKEDAGGDMSDWDYDNESNNESARDTDYDETPKTGFFSESDPQIQKQVQFKSMSKNFNGKRNPSSGIPTIFEEGGDDDDEDDGQNNQASKPSEIAQRPSLAKSKTKSSEKKGKRY
ncbi:LANO_0F09384g1_1 [Lachancea nothofagi CBS 11611]|uniref:LANO_0F09384g1_1 n=1 Tax=Lachancea nothofagi CBS 11611 TaxID=1266666 RepID=A0A1G4KA26_9SACH|nr:LANO_0F09384g1_1 [Lachancea nothofagi CBS 11611]